MTRYRDIPGVCAALIQICNDVTAYQTRFLNSVGLTWDKARALAPAQQEALQARFMAWRVDNPMP